MRRVFRRIAVNGSLTALVLGVVGLLYAELAATWLGGSGGRGAQADADFQGQLRSRVPLLMAVWGVVFVVVAESVLFIVRGEPGAKPKAAAPPDEAEVLLEELLRQAEAKQAQERAGGSGAGASAQNGGPEQAGASILTPDTHSPPRTP